MYLLIIFGPVISVMLVSFFFNLLPRYIFIISIFGSLFMSLILCTVAVYEVVYLNSFCLVELDTWFKLGVLNVKWSFYFDKLSTFMLFLIIFILLSFMQFFLINSYSSGLLSSKTTIISKFLYVCDLTELIASLKKDFLYLL